MFENEKQIPKSNTSNSFDCLSILIALARIFFPLTEF